MFFGTQCRDDQGGVEVQFNLEAKHAITTEEHKNMNNSEFSMQ